MYMFVQVHHPKGDHFLSMYLILANPESLPLGWKIRAYYSFVLLNQSGKELFSIHDRKLYCALAPGWGCPSGVTLKTIQKYGFMEKNKLIIKVEVEVVESDDEEEEEEEEIVKVATLFTEHPDIAVNFKPKNQQVKTTYMNVLLGLIETLNKPPHSFSETEISNARSELIELTEAGFKLEWLKTKLDEVSLEKKKTNAYNSRVQELKKKIRNLNYELDTEKAKSATCAAKILSLEQKVSDLNDKLNEKEAKLLLLKSCLLWNCEE
ncbi:unnamed protein product [Thlaspi arvense]|uniref:MATH domain-containing protein n=1 Tax=Thlaspi arvense TaxID=13288 RepID=A0AAU9RUN3_THLAR|nr:unnamed protein product [Thlaspi arvense]